MTPFDHPGVEVVVRVGLSLLLPLPLGWERGRRSRSAGLRTYPLVSACVCGFLVLAQRSWGPSGQADIFYGVLTGIGFVASGAILKGRGGDMSTAVSLWVTGAIGAAVAYGAPWLAASLSLLSILGLRGPSLVRHRQAAP
jgi:putative Mg2+ transporter-C (MgtC) family protein